MHSYLKNRKQQIQISKKFSAESTVTAAVPQGSIDGTLLFNLFINDLVFFIHFCTLNSYADVIENFIVLNLEQSHFMCIDKETDDTETLNFSDLAMKNSAEVGILRITLDRNINFHTHIKNILRKQVKNLKSMIKPQFNYCVLICMFCSRQSNNLINKVHRRGLRLTYRDEIKHFRQIPKQQNEITIHQRNLQVLMAEV